MAGTTGLEPATSAVTALAASSGSGDAHELLDARTPAEFSSTHVPGARLIPLRELKADAFLSQ